jgi:large subunit ribosomal protein L30
MPKKDANAKRIKITLVRSPIGNTERHKQTVRALGLHRIGQTVEQPDTSAIRGMIAKINHLVTVEVQEVK